MLAAQWTGWEVLAFAGVLACLLLAWAALRFRGYGLKDIGLKPGSFNHRSVFVAGLAVLCLLFLGHALKALLTAWLGWSPDISRFDKLRGNITLLVLGLAVVWTSAAFGEELLCRGYLMHTLHGLFEKRLGQRLAWGMAVLLSSIAFGLAHAYQGLAGVILTGFMGLGFATSYFVARRSLGAAILTHGMYDTVAFVVVFLSLDQVLSASGGSWA
jgi:membrane protease YdiL (CAAX protease family)